LIGTNIDEARKPLPIIPTGVSMRTVVERRESFEDWARNAVPQFSASGKYVRDGKWSYNHNIVNIMWQCWQQALVKAHHPEEVLK
jgi:hypothetical protein